LPNVTGSFDKDFSKMAGTIYTNCDSAPEQPLLEDGASSKARTVGIIGGGVSGVVTARVLLEKGFHCSLFECTDQLGGVWAENYVGFGIQVPSALYEFPDEPLPEGFDFCSGPKICRYIRQYAEKHGVTEVANFNSRVLAITPKGTEGYDVNYEDTTGMHTKSFDIVVVATGVYGKQDKYIPNWEGKDKFEGEIIHCADYLDLGVSKGKHVISVGYGKSSFDCAQVSVQVAASSTILFREAHWCVPRKILGLVPFEFATFSRFGAACLQPMYVAAGPIEKFLHAIPFVLTFFWHLVAFIFQKQFGMPQQCIPEKSFIADFWGGHGILPHPDFFPLVNNGSIKAIKGEIKSIKERSVLLASGDELPCDVIVAATGYKPVRNFLPKDVAELKEKDGLWLYRQMVHPNHPGLIFLNSETTTFTNITTASIQARWLAEMLAGTFTLPSTQEMYGQIGEMQKWKRSTMPNAGAARAYMIQTHQVHYYDQLLKDMGASIRRKQGFAAALKEVFEPYRPRDYCSIISGNFQRRQGEQAKPGSLQAPFWKELLVTLAVLFVVPAVVRIFFSRAMPELNF
jgi:cation diffusion facilitator CzcD-associated flavoprotein CzcO